MSKVKIEKLFQLGITFAEKIKSQTDSLSATDEEQLAFRGVMLFFFCKAYKSYQAIRLLWNNGFSEDATILARTIFELDLQARYIRGNSNLVRLFLEYDPVLRDRTYLRMKELGDALFVADVEKRTSDLSELKDQYEKFKSNYPIGKNWWGGSIKQLADKLGEQAQFNYAAFYAMESNMVHSNASIIRDYIETHQNSILVNCYPTESEDMTVPSVATVRFLGVLFFVAESIELNLNFEMENASKEYKKILTDG